MKKILPIVYGCFFAISAFSQTVIRGPYLQSPGPESLIVCWRTDVATDSRVFYRPDNWQPHVAVIDQFLDQPYYQEYQSYLILIIYP